MRRGWKLEPAGKAVTLGELRNFLRGVPDDADPTAVINVSTRFPGNTLKSISVETDEVVRPPATGRGGGGGGSSAR